MAKRASAGKGGVVIAQEILSIVQANKAIKGPEMMVVLREKFPKHDFNEASCQVAYANARKKLGLTRTVVKRPAGAGRPAQVTGRLKPVPAAAPSAASPDMNLLQAAKALLQFCNGDAAVAQMALKQVAALQMG